MKGRVLFSVRLLTSFLVLAVPPSGLAEEQHACATSNAIEGVVHAHHRGQGFSLMGAQDVYALSGITPKTLPRVGAQVALYPVGEGKDRYGRTVVQGFQGKTWLQGEALRTGKGIAFALDEPATCVDAMRKLEQQAQAAKIGIWAQNAMLYSATDVEPLLRKLGKMVIVYGKVRSVGNRTRRLYLNFGQKWSQDFTVSVVKQGSGAFKENTKGSLDRLSALKGKTVRVRGVLEERQGPLIRLVDEAQIEILD